MSVIDDERRTCLVRALEATVAGDSSAVDELFTADVVAWSPTISVRSRVELAVEIEDHEESFSDIELTTRPVVVAHAWACAEWVVSAIHSGPLVRRDDAPIEPTGRRISIRGVTVAEFDGSRICAVRHYWDEVELLANLGLAHQA